MRPVTLLLSLFAGLVLLSLASLFGALIIPRLVSHQDGGPQVVGVLPAEQGGGLVYSQEVRPLMRLDEDTLPIICITLVIIIAILSKTFLHLNATKVRQASRAQQAEEARMIQEMHSSLVRMEKRIEALETLYMDKAREESFIERL